MLYFGISEQISLLRKKKLKDSGTSQQKKRQFLSSPLEDGKNIFFSVTGPEDTCAEYSKHECFIMAKALENLEVSHAVLVTNSFGGSGCSSDHAAPAASCVHL